MMSTQTPLRPSSAPGIAAKTRRADQAWREGLQHSKAGQHAQARSAFTRAVRDVPEDALYWIHLARSEWRLGNPKAAIEAAQRATRLEPARWAYGQYLISLLHQARDFAPILDVLDRFAGAAPPAELTAAWHSARCEALLELGRTREAVPHGMTAIGFTLSGTEQDLAERMGLRRRTALLMGHGLSKMARFADAAVCYRMALDTDRHAIGSALYAAHCSAWVCDWNELRTDLQRLDDTVQAVRALPAGVQPEDLSAFCLVGLSDDPGLMRWAAEHADANAAARSAAAPRRNDPIPRPDGRLRIGLMSSDFHQHATSMLMVQMLEHIDRSRYELYFYSSGQDDRTPLRQRVLATATRVHEVAQWPGTRIAQQMRDDRIGVLIDLKGSTTGARLDVIPCRPAPLQVAWLGYPGTSGSHHIDYVIGDAVVTPLANQADFTEAIAQMPHCYQPNDGQRSRPAPWSRTQCGLPEDALVLASFNQAYKITPDVFAAWCQVLAATPRAVLWMLVAHPDTQARLREAAQAHGVDGQRLIFASFVDMELHRARLLQADLMLDTFPCSGHTTASDALWAGVPVLTLIGRTFASRVAASLLHTLGLDELVCADLDTYTARALALCHDTTARADVRERLVQAIGTSPLFDGARFAADWQALIERMVARQDAGLPPAPLAALTTAPAPSTGVDSTI